MSVQAKSIRTKNYYSKIVDQIQRPYYFARGLVRKLSRSLSFAQLGWSNYDFDGEYLIAMMLFKLRRLEKALTVDAFCHHSPTTLKSLRLAIKLGRRLTEDVYDKAHSRHEKKWGKLHVAFVPVPGFDGSEAKFWRDKTTPETKHQEREENMAAINEDDAAKERDTRLFFDIIKTHLKNWWD